MLQLVTGILRKQIYIVIVPCLTGSYQNDQDLRIGLGAMVKIKYLKIMKL